MIREESKAVRAKGKSPVNKTFASIHKKDVAFAQTKPNQVCMYYGQYSQTILLIFNKICLTFQAFYFIDII